MQDHLPIEDHRQAVTLHGNDITVPLSHLIVCRNPRGKRRPDWKGLLPIVTNPIDLPGTNRPVPEIDLSADCPSQKDPAVILVDLGGHTLLVRTGFLEAIENQDRLVAYA